MEETLITITVYCERDKVDPVIHKLLDEGWEKDTNMHELTSCGKVKFEMWRHERF